VPVVIAVHGCGGEAAGSDDSAFRRLRVWCEGCGADFAKVSDKKTLRVSHTCILRLPYYATRTDFSEYTFGIGGILGSR
jgi:hypothetical protein